MEFPSPYLNVRRIEAADLCDSKSSLHTVVYDKFHRLEIEPINLVIGNPAYNS
ncbi:uncharacterized protein G2W53_044574 [Senna tora]|nr:uncharacterized protein G2W53_044574 [Senna tora]